MTDYDPELVEQAARALYETEGGDMWEREYREAREAFMGQARAVLEAVAPALTAQGKAQDIAGLLRTQRSLLDEHYQRGMVAGGKQVAEELADTKAAHRIAAEAVDRFRDLVEECLGLDENPGDDELVRQLRAHFGKTGPESRRWRDFMVGAEAMRDQIEAEHAAREAVARIEGGS